MNENMAMTTYDDTMSGMISISEDLQSHPNSYCSIRANSVEEKKALYNMMNSADERIADCINKVINVKDIYIESVEVKNEEGISSIAPRIILMDTEGRTYASVSVGIYNSIRKLVQVFGEPTWADGIPVKVVQHTKGNRKMLSLVIA